MDRLHRWIRNIDKGIPLEVRGAAVQPELSLGVRPDLKPHDNIAGVNTRRGYVEARAANDRPDHKLWTHADHVPAHAIAVHAAADEADIPVVRTLPQLKVHSGVNASAYGGVRFECASGRSRNNGNFSRGHYPAGFEVKVPATHKIVVIGKLGMEVGRQVGCP